MTAEKTRPHRRVPRPDDNGELATKFPHTATPEQRHYDDQFCAIASKRHMRHAGRVRGHRFSSRTSSEWSVLMYDARVGDTEFIVRYEHGLPLVTTIIVGGDASRFGEQAAA